MISKKGHIAGFHSPECWFPFYWIVGFLRPEYPSKQALLSRHYLHDHFIKSTNTHYEDYRISMDELIANMTNQSSVVSKEEDIDFGPVF